VPRSHSGSEGNIDLVLQYRHLLARLLQSRDGAVVVAGQGSVVVQLTAPSEAVAFARHALQILSMIGVRAEAALHVAWVTWIGGSVDYEGSNELADAIEAATTGQIVATAAFRLHLQPDAPNWTLLKTAATLYELPGNPVPADRRLTQSWPIDGPRPRRQVRSLSRREREVAALVGNGKTNREVASALRIAPSTVERHVSNLFDKLNVHSRVTVAVIAATGQLQAP
jgi:DNA-binding CsgD family transcriptional regulator